MILWSKNKVFVASNTIIILESLRRCEYIHFLGITGVIIVLLEEANERNYADSCIAGTLDRSAIVGIDDILTYEDSGDESRAEGQQKTV